MAEAETELKAALAAAITVGDLDGVDVPGVIIYGEGIDPGRLVTGQVEASFRLTFVGGAWDGKGSSASLRSIITLALPA